MSRTTRTIVVLITILVVLGGLGYAAHSMNLVGLLVSMHQPPQH
ncbi:MAG: hypothetical protein ABIQ30_04745 [Devosia sp.]